MKKKFAVLVCLILTLCCALVGCSNSYKKLPTKGNKFVLDNSWKMTFCDDFDSVNLDNWKVNTMPDNKNIRRAGIYTDSSDVLFANGGNLFIRTLYKTSAAGTGWHTSWLESSVVKGEASTTNPDYTGLSQTYGYFEIRCKVPASVGIWSAFWMMPDGAKGMTQNDELNTGHDGLEVDIMESPYMYNKVKNLNTHVAHGDGYGDNLKSDKSDTYKVPNMYTEFHTYALEWNADEYIFYIDGFETYRTKYVQRDEKGNITKTLGVSQVAEYLILSVEVAGCEKDGALVPGKTFNSATGEFEDFWCGNPDTNDKSKSYDFVIDYVKAYQKVK
ncbi:MAG: glycoside hydrolase family 16 protein [Clostridia bacterium]